jgi:hypothetical protein
LRFKTSLRKSPFQSLMRPALRVNLAAIAHTATVRSALMATARTVALAIVQNAVHVHSVTAMTAHAPRVHQAKAR